jgi:ATPase subunit of ABC transporter with duplicated ATPase domains
VGAPERQARRSKSKARLAAYQQMVRKKDKQATLDPRRSSHPARPAPRRPRDRGRRVSKGFGDRLLIDNLSFKLPPNGIVGVIGPNGAGKSTLFKMITGQETPDAGTIRLGETVKLAYVDQSRDDARSQQDGLAGDLGGLDIIKVGNREINSRAYVGSFNFKGGDQQKKVGQLSGGERNRVHLAKTLTEGGNVILLDEPTNDLDIETLQNLEEALEEFAGCAW